MNQFWKSGKLDLTLQPISYCNTACLHCSLPNSIKASKKMLPAHWVNDNFFNLLDGVVKKGINEIELTIIGGEIFLLSKDLQIYYFSELVKKVRFFAEKKNIKINYTIITNFLMNSKNFDVLDKLTELENKNIDFDIYTSYELGTNRFEKPEYYDNWLKNIEKYKDRYNLGCFITLTKKTCENIEEVFSLISGKFKKIAFQPIDLKGESRNNLHLFPSRDELLKALKYLSNQKKELEKKENGIEIYLNIHEQKHEYSLSIDNFGQVSGVYNLQINEKIDEKKMLKDLSINEMDQFLDLNFKLQKTERIKKYTKSKMCHSCDKIEQCRFGFERQWQDFYDTKEHKHCHAFKELLDES